jgi:hypothetical protein
MKQIVEHLQLLSGLTRRQSFDLLFNLAYINTDFKYLLSVTHDTATRARLLANKDKVVIADSTYSLREALDKLRLSGLTKITIPTDIYYIIYKVADGISQSLREDLRNSLGYSVYPVEIFIPPKELKECHVCSYTSTKDICKSCTDKLKAFTEYRRESFKLSINYLNFNIKSSINLDSSFSLRYKDWEIRKEGEEVTYTLTSTLFESTREDYPLPFEEYRLRIV